MLTCASRRQFDCQIPICFIAKAVLRFDQTVVDLGIKLCLPIQIMDLIRIVQTAKTPRPVLSSLLYGVRAVITSPQRE